jgi:chaperonin GroES
MKLRPLQDRVIVKQTGSRGEDQERHLPPDAAKEKLHHRQVIACRPGQARRQRKPMELPVRAATPSTTASGAAPSSRSTGTKYVILRETDLLGVLE